MGRGVGVIGEGGVRMGRYGDLVTKYRVYYRRGERRKIIENKREEEEGWRG
jgi:hypothetical protein